MNLESGFDLSECKRAIARVLAAVERRQRLTRERVHDAALRVTRVVEASGALELPHLERLADHLSGDLTDPADEHDDD